MIKEALKDTSDQPKINLIIVIKCEKCMRKYVDIIQCISNNLKKRTKKTRGEKMFYHKCGQRLEELEKEWKEDCICPKCGEVIKPYRGHIFNTDTIEYKLEDGIEFSN